jgi:recombination protein RecA
MYGEGISREGDVLDLGAAQRVVEKSGAWFSYKGDRLGQGRENAKQSLKENPELLKKIENEVKAKLGLPVKAAASELKETSTAAGKAAK